jgi:hypothetical protein
LDGGLKIKESLWFLSILLVEKIVSVRHWVAIDTYINLKCAIFVGNSSMSLLNFFDQLGKFQVTE